MMRTVAAGCGVLCASVLAGCGGSHLVPDAAHGYLYRYGNGEAFVQWQRHGQEVHGTLNETTIACCVPIPARITERTLAVRWDGALHSYGLLIRSEYPSGAPLGVRYRRASGADYYAAVAQTKAALRRQENG